MPNDLTTNATELSTSTGTTQYTPVPGGKPMNYDQLYLSYGLAALVFIILAACWIPSYSKMNPDVRLGIRIIGTIVAVPLMFAIFMLYGAAHVGGF